MEVIKLVYNSVKDVSIYFGGMFGLSLLDISDYWFSIAFIFSAPLLIFKLINEYRKYRDYAPQIVEKHIIKEVAISKDKIELNTREEEMKRKREIEANKPKSRTIIRNN